jgi:hypothetical protein
MISIECRIADFVGAIRGKDYYDAVRMADAEVTEAERRLLRSSSDAELRQRCGLAYAQTIKHLIRYMRYGLRPPRRVGMHADLLQAVPTAGAPRHRTSSPAGRLAAPKFTDS